MPRRTRTLRSSSVRTTASAVDGRAAADAFADDDGNIHELAINQLAAMGVVQGRLDGSFGPDDPLQRDQMATFLVNAYTQLAGGAPTSGTDFFPDDEGSVHESAINALAAPGVAAGSTDGSYRPTAPVRRDQMASFIVRLLDLLIEAGYASAPG